MKNDLLFDWHASVLVKLNSVHRFLQNEKTFKYQINSKAKRNVIQIVTAAMVAADLSSGKIIIILS